MYSLYVLLFWLILFLLFLVMFGLFSLTFLFSILFMIYYRNLQLVRTSVVCCFSILHSSGVDETVLAPCFKVLMTLYLAPM